MTRKNFSILRAQMSAERQERANERTARMLDEPVADQPPREPIARADSSPMHGGEASDSDTR
jgi:hypothetical protein